MAKEGRGNERHKSAALGNKTGNNKPANKIIYSLLALRLLLYTSDWHTSDSPRANIHTYNCVQPLNDCGARCPLDRCRRPRQARPQRRPARGEQRKEEELGSSSSRQLRVGSGRERASWRRMSEPLSGCQIFPAQHPFVLALALAALWRRAQMDFSNVAASSLARRGLARPL